MKKLYITLILLWVALPILLAQSPTRNYIKVSTPIIGKSSISNNTKEENIIVQYYDDLGYLEQTNQTGISPTFKDLIVLQEYNGLGLESFKWLPHAKESNNGLYVFPSDLKTAMNTAYSSTGLPYNTTLYDNSPLNRVSEIYNPGGEWRATGRSNGMIYLTNTDEYKCIQYISTDDGKITKIEKKSENLVNHLSVIRYKDENNNISFEFKNKLGQIVLSRQMDGTIAYDTYYIYDNYGNLRVVLPPEAADILSKQTGPWTDSDVNLQQLAYLYLYDGRNRCIAKKIPGNDWIYYVYDKADRLIFTQDGEQRIKSPQQWTFTIPDAFERVVVTGTCENSLGYASDPLKSIVANAIWSGGTSSYKGYTVSGVSLTNPKVLRVNYYDQYEFIATNDIPNDTHTNYNTESGYGIQYTDGHKGLLTGTVTGQYLPDGSVSATYLYSIMYYDYRGNLVQTKSNNHLTAGLEKNYIDYNFTGQPTSKKHIHSAAGKTTLTEYYTYVYDHAGRLLKTTHRLNNATTPVTLNDNIYDDLGRLQSSRKNDLDYLKLTYSYNHRSWLKSISSTFYSQTLFYNDIYVGNTKQYNGNISAMTWKAAGESNTHGYAFIYDPLSRLSSATYLLNGAIPATNNYKTSYSYDKHGNLKTLQRYGKITASAYNLVDNLTMTYVGNQLTKVEDAIGTISLAESADFKNYSNVAKEYTYNKNGAMTQDLNKGISVIQYNSLNLPRQIDIKSPVAEARNEYTYSTEGQKLKIVQKWNPNYSNAPIIGSTINTAALTQTKTSDYVGNIIYENNVLKRILVDGGYIEGGIYYFYLTDHLGNNRVVANASGTVIQKNHYYPFGTAFAENTADEQKQQPYKYNGKELDQMHGLNLYDYSARYKDDFRFIIPDPHAENYYSWSPYHYAANNPIRITDPTGMDWFKSKDGTVQYFKDKTDNFDNWTHLSANKFDKSVLDAIGSDIMAATEKSLDNGWSKFINYFENSDLGKDYFQIASWNNYNDNSSGLMGVIAKIPGIKESIRISQMTHEWADASGWTRTKNAIEHNIGMFLTSESYGPEFANFVGNSNEIRGLLFNDRQAGQMMNALRGIGNTAFEWTDLEHNDVGIQKWRTYRNSPSADQIYTRNGAHIAPWINMGFK